jgi:hypothetical protein
MPHYVNIAWGCLFSGTSGTVVVVGVQRLFALSDGAALSHRRNEDGYVQQVRWLAKSVTEINNRRAGVGSEAKRPCKP